MSQSRSPQSFLIIAARAHYSTVFSARPPLAQVCLTPPPCLSSSRRRSETKAQARQILASGSAAVTAETAAEVRELYESQRSHQVHRAAVRVCQKEVLFPRILAPFEQVDTTSDFFSSLHHGPDRLPSPWIPGRCIGSTSALYRTLQAWRDVFHTCRLIRKVGPRGLSHPSPSQPLHRLWRESSPSTLRIAETRD